MSMEEIVLRVFWAAGLPMLLHYGCGGRVIEPLQQCLRCGSKGETLLVVTSDDQAS